MKNTIKLSTLALALSALSLASAQTATTPLKATATLNSSCTISATGVTFGAIMAPLNAQSSSGNMNILCNAGTAYTINLAYGGMYGQLGPGDYLAVGGTPQAGYIVYSRYTSTGVLIPNSTVAIRDINYPSYAAVGSALGGCTYTPTACTFASSSYAYGKMIGVAKGDNIAYSISVPGNPGQVWNTGAGSYTGTGTGDTQSLPILAQIVPGQSGRPYPTADTYIDTVTATLSY
jgi:spore coat protein U-like protein